MWNGKEKSLFSTKSRPNPPVRTKVYAVLCFWRRKKKPRRYLGLGLRPPNRESKKRLSTTASETSDFIGLPGQLPDDGLISLKEFLMLNQSSLYLLQKHLVSHAESDPRKTKHSTLYEAPTISADKCGPLGILAQKFGEE